MYTYPDICSILMVLSLDEQFWCIHEITSCELLNSCPLCDVLLLQIPVDSVRVLTETCCKMIAILFSTGCRIVDEGCWGRRRTYLGSNSLMAVKKGVWVEQDNNNLHDGCEKEPHIASAIFGHRESSSLRLYMIFICDNLADAATKLSILEKRWRWLWIWGNSQPQNHSVGNAQYVHTGPAASIPSTCRRAWIVNRQVERWLGEYW